MKTRTIVVAALAVALLAFPAGAQDSFKVSLLNGTQILSATAPVPSGTMLLVKNLSDGSLTAVPAELVSSVSKASGKTINNAAGSLASAKMSRTLARSGAAATLTGSKTVTLTGALATSKAQANLTQSLGAARAAAGIGNATTIFLGPTGGGAGTSVATGGTASTALAPLSASAAQSQIFVGDLPRLTPRDGLTAGMLTPTLDQVVIGPNGFPVPATATTLAVPIGPNGFPDFTAGTAAAPAATPVIGLNGFPVTAAGTPVIGLNGFPLTAAGTVPTTSLTPTTAANGTGTPVTLSRAATPGSGAINVHRERRPQDPG